MSKFKLECTSSGTQTVIVINDVLLNDTWEGTEDDWGILGGKVTNFGQPETYLANGTSQPHTLSGFSSDLEPGKKGSGTKTTLDGSFPFGLFEWEIIEKS